MGLLARFWTPIALSSLLLAIVVVAWATGDGILARTVTDALIRVVLVVGLYIFIGNSGVLSFGHIAFMLIGAYGTAWLTLTPFKKSFALQLPEFLSATQYPMLPSAIAASLLAAAVAVVVGVPIMRLSGIAASIATLAVLGMFKTFYTNWNAWTMGAATLPGVPLYVNMWVALGWSVVALFAAFLYQQSRYGLALRASREDEFAARASGIDIPFQRLVAFVLSAFFVGLAGVLHAHFLGAIAVKSFWLGMTFISIAMLIVGGQRSLTGAVVGVVFISTVVELLLKVEDGFSIGALEISAPPGIQELGIAIVMLLILIFRPSGIMAGREIASPFRTRVLRGTKAEATVPAADTDATPG